MSNSDTAKTLQHKMIKKTRILAPVLIAVAVLMGSCSSDNKTNWENYKDWRQYNEQWLKEQTSRTNPDGTPFYTTVVAPWNPQQYILMHYWGDPAQNAGNLKPLFTSTATVNYTVQLANDTVSDSGTAFTSQLSSSGLIAGWSLGLMQMHVGDSCEIIMPYEVAYGSSGYGSIPPYSDLRFNVRLTDIPQYVVKP